MSQDHPRPYNLHINGQTHSVEVDPDTPLLWVLRDILGLTGTKYGCGIGMCRICTVHMDGIARPSCQVRIDDIGKATIVTIEGYSQNGLTAVQQAWVDADVPQCGYCQSGQIMTAAALLNANPAPSDSEVETAMNAVLCRCGTYPGIKKAINALLSDEREMDGKHQSDDADKA